MHQETAPLYLHVWDRVCTDRHVYGIMYKPDTKKQGFHKSFDQILQNIRPK